jgi:hypothetical protein
MLYFGLYTPNECILYSTFAHEMALLALRARNFETEEDPARQYGCEGPENAREILF